MPFRPSLILLPALEKAPALENPHRFGEARLKLLHQIRGFGLGAFFDALYEDGLHRLAHFGLAALGTGTSTLR